MPSGFTIELVAAEPQVKYPMFAAFDDRGRLFVAESSGLDLYEELVAQTRKCRIRVLEDLDGDGRFEASRVFADKLVFPMGLVWRGGKLYVADPPDLVTFEDTNGDGTADRRTVILTGFGHRDNGSLHGLVFGPDGWLYMTMGSPDGYRLQQADGSVVEGESGALIRCRPDGSDPQIVCRGFENLVEVVFTPRGEIFGTDNWYRNVNLPGSEGLRDALVHLLEGGLYPYHADRGTPQPLTGQPLGAVSLFPAVALSGLARYEGTLFPTEYRGQLFSAQHNARKVGRHVLIAEGSTYRAEDVDFVWCEQPDFHPSDVLEDADGSLLVVDTGSWYVQHCPTGRIRGTYAPGGIYRVRWEGSTPRPDPWGNEEDWATASMERLVDLLADPRPAVRDRAVQALVVRGGLAVAPLVAAFEWTKTDIATQQRIVWTLANIHGGGSRRPLRSALDSADPELVTTAARALRSLRDPGSAQRLCELLDADTPHVRLAAAEALAHCGTTDSLPAIWQALSGEPDRFLEHALIHAAHRLADLEHLQAALDEEHPRVQKAALLLLDQPPRPRGAVTRDAVLSRISATDRELRQTAIRILVQRSEWIDQAVALVRSWLVTAVLSDEEQERLQNTILALEAQPALQDVLADAVADTSGDIPIARQAEILSAFGESKLPIPPPSWIQTVRRAIEHHDAAIRRQAVRTAATWQLAEFAEPLARIAAASHEPGEIRVEAISGVVGRQPKLAPEVFELLMGELSNEANPLRRLRAAEVIGRGVLSDDQLARLLEAVAEDALISPAVLLPVVQKSAGPATASLAAEYLEVSLRHGWHPAESQLRDVLRSLPVDDERRERILGLLQKATANQRASLESYDPLLAGGDPVRGRQVFAGSKVACASCHRVGADGGSVGPDLTHIGAVRSPRDLLESIVFPSASFAQGYESYLVTTVEGHTSVGTMAQQTADLVVLRDSSAALHRVPRNDIETLERQNVSLMPDGLPHAMTRDEFRDLLAYLQTLR